MKKTILITGTSSGIGKAAVRLFSAKGWNVAATMRRPEQEIELGQLPNVRLYKLDVMDENSIQTALQDILKDFGGLDAIVNNAGYGAVGIFEAATPEQIRKQFDTNVFGVMNVIRAVLPHFRAKRNGTIINITSMGGPITFPIYSVYHGTKWAVEGFSEALQFELRYFNIRVKCVEPGAIKTDFYDRSMDLFKKEDLTDYDAYQEVAYRNSQQAGYNAPGPEMVARKIYQAANDSSFRLRYPVGKEAPSLLVLRRLIPLSWFTFMVRMVVEKGFRNLQPA
jgi:NAD(P)-dependent dehydrogenase (short-subunit alcohol dehydrogenase family)